MERIARKHGLSIADAITHAIEHQFPPLNQIQEASTNSAIEDRVRQLENVILRTIDTYRTLDFYKAHQQRLLQQSTTQQTVRPRVSTSEHCFNENMVVPVGYYTAGKSV